MRASTSRPLHLAIVFALALSVVFVIGGWAAVRHERNHMRDFVEEASAAESRWAYVLLMQAIDPLLASRRDGAIGAEVAARIDAFAADIASRSRIRKVKIFETSGQLLHAVPRSSASPAVQGTDPVFAAVRSGRLVKDVRRVEGFEGVGGRRLDGYVVGTYFPHFPEGGTSGAPDLVVELYVDITETVMRAESDLRAHIASVIAGLAAFYLLIVGSVLWGARAVSRMERLKEQSAAAALAKEHQLQEAKSRAEENEAFLREAIGSMEYGFLLLDPQKRSLFWNERYIELLPPVAPVLRRGATLRELIAALSESPLYAIPLPERESWTDMAVPRLWDGQPFRRRLTNGRTLRIALMPTREGGRVLSLQDISDDVAAEDRMAHLALVAEHTDNAVLIATAEGSVEWVNAGFARVTGHDAAEVVGRPLADVLDFADDTGGRERARIAEAVAGGTSFDAELLCRSKLGVQVWLQLASTPVRDAKGRVTRHVVIASDVTTRKAQERRLADALERERALVAQQKRFVSIAAHELRTPLTIIDGAAQRLVRNAEWITPAELRERAGRIRAGVTRLAQLVDTTLDSARLDEGRIELDAKPLDLRGLVAGVVRRLGGMSNPIRFVIGGSEDRVEVEGDGRLLDQVFGNLVSNAIKYSGNGRQVEIDFTVDPESVAVAIRDHGIGIPESELPKLFERFYRASTAKGLPGTGIGLHLVRELVALHGGSVEVSSTVGEGSVFTVRLPRRQQGKAIEPGSPRAAE